MVVADKGLNAGEVVGAVGTKGGDGGCGWERWGCLVFEQDPPKLCAGGFTPTGDNGLLFLVVDDDVVAVDLDLAARVAEGTDSDKGVGEGGYDVAFTCGEFGKL